MLKTIPPTTSCGCGYFKSKCAEIHYQTTTFSILCIFCGMKTLDYQGFVEHFQKLHFEDFANTMQSTAEPVVTPIYQRKKSHHDPLEFCDKEVADDPEEVMKKLKEERLEVKEVKTEDADVFTTTAVLENNADNAGSETRANSGTPAPIDFEDFNDSDDEFLICKVKVEHGDLHAANPSRPTKTKRRVVPLRNEDDYEEEENCAYPLVNDTTTDVHDRAAHDDAEDNDVDSDRKYVTDEEDIDWSKPYEPTLLKNHEKRPYKPRNKPNLCTYCGRTFKRRYQLETHLNVHTGEKPHQCDICGRLFRAITTLTRHLNTHELRDTFHCKFCNKAFSHKVAFLSHELRHTQARTVPCNECDKWFYTANQMDTHKRKVHNKSDNPDDLPFVCEICSKRYRTGSMLSTHKFKKHYKTAKFSCEQCGKKFVQEQQLLQHKHIHIDGYSSANNLQLENHKELSG